MAVLSSLLIQLGLVYGNCINKNLKVTSILQCLHYVAFYSCNTFCNLKTEMHAGVGST